MVTTSLVTFSVDRQGNFVGYTDTFSSGDKVGIEATVEDESGSPLSGVQVFVDIKDGNGTVVSSVQGFTDESGVVSMQWKTAKREPTGNYTVELVNLLRSDYEFDASGSVTSVTFVLQ